MKKMRLVAQGVVALCLAAGVAVYAASTATASTPSTGAAAAATPTASPTTAPRTLNDFSCRPTPAHPFPVILVHGTLETSAMWGAFAPTLLAKGYCVFAVDYGNSGTGEIAASAQQLATFVDKVRTSTHAYKVDLVGHSQGGMMPRYYMKFLGGAHKVHQLIGIAPSNYGTTVQMPPDLDCVACHEQAQGSDFLNKLNAGTDTVPGVFFTVIATTKDEVVTPYTNTFLKGRGALNIVIQKVCADDASGHIALATSDQNTWQLVYGALDPLHAKRVSCVAATDPA